MKLFDLNKVNGRKNVSFDTRKRNRAKNVFEKEFFKLLVNAASGIFLRKRSKSFGIRNN